MQGNITTLGNRVLDGDQCRALMELAERQPFTEDQDEIESGTSRFKVGQDEIEVYNIVPDDRGLIDFDKVIGRVEQYMPDGDCFEEPSHVQITCYPADSYEFNTSGDMDSGQVIFSLSEGYHGGSMVIDGSSIVSELGDMIIINNPFDRNIGVLPITVGEKWVMTIWFRPQEHEDNTSDTSEVTDGPTFAKVVIK